MLNNLISSDSNNRAAVVIFAGWGMDSLPFKSFRVDTLDTIVVYDYASEEDPAGDILAHHLQESYDSICVVAWSFGVFHAERWLIRHPLVPVTLRVAVNGTSWAVDTRRGIHPSVFRLTLKNHSSGMIQRFRENMCGNKDTYAQFMAHEPLRSEESLRRELEQIADLTCEGTKTSPDLWDIVYVGMADKIIKPDAQLRAWDGHESIIRIEGGAHFPDWDEIRDNLKRLLIDKNRIASRFRQAAKTYNANAPVQANMAVKLAGMLPAPISGDVLEIGPGTGLLTALLRRRLTSDSSLRLWDIAPLDDDIEEVDAETGIRMEPDNSLDMIVSSSTIQWFQSPVSFFRECRRVLRPGGIAAFSTFGKDTFHEINHLLGKPLTYHSAGNWNQIALNAGWQNVEATEASETMKFENPLDVLRHMKLTGVNGLMSEGSSVKAARLITTLYPRDTDGKCPLTYQPVYIILRK